MEFAGRHRLFTDVIVLHSPVNPSGGYDTTNSLFTVNPANSGKGYVVGAFVLEIGGGAATLINCTLDAPKRRKDYSGCLTVINTLFRCSSKRK